MYDLIWRGGQRYGKQWREQYALMFFMFYDAGQAAALANAQTELDFWHMINYGVDSFKRGTERRHFRGEKVRQATLNFQHMGSPEAVWYRMQKPTFSQMVDNIADNFQGCQIGPYFAWKAMDLLDRGMGIPVSLSLKEAVKGMPEEPRKCAQAIWPGAPLDEVLEEVVDYTCGFEAPGKPGKSCGYAEAETVLCMMKGYFLTKSHTIGDDVDEKHAQLKDHPYLLDLLPPKQDWKKYEQAVDAA